MYFSDPVKVNRDIELIVTQILELTKNGEITDTTRKETVKKLFFPNIPNTTFRLATTDERLFHLFYKSDIFNVTVQERIQSALIEDGANISAISKKTGISIDAIRTYKRWIAQNKTLTAEQHTRFNDYYDKYMDNEMSKDTFAKIVFDTHNRDTIVQLIDLYMHSNGLISRMHFNRCRGDAEGRKIEFNISASEINSIYKEQGGKSAVSKQPIYSFYRSFNRSDEHVYSIDRIDSNAHYERSNIQLMTKKENIMKGVLSNEQFIYNAILIAKHQYSKKQSQVGLVISELDELLADLTRGASSPITKNVDFLFDIDNSPFCY